MEEKLDVKTDAIEKAQKLRDGIKYGFNKTGEMVMGILSDYYLY